MTQTHRPTERITGIVWGLDLGRRTGFAFGRPGERPQSGTWEFTGDRGEMFGEIMANLQAAWKVERPALVVAEAPLTVAALLNVKSNLDNIQVTYGLHAIVSGMCNRFSGVRFQECHNATCRKHFIGVGRMGERGATKAAVVARCHLMKLVPTTCFDEDRCDAICVHDWACATYGQRAASIKELYLVGERPRQ